MSPTTTSSGRLERVISAIGLMAASLGVQKCGKAKMGDKTLVDALHPAAEAFSSAINAGASLEVAGQAMLEAARAGRDAATPFKKHDWVGKLGGWN